MRSCASIVLVFLGSVCSAVAKGGGRPLSSFDKLLSMTVLTTSWWMLQIADLQPVLLFGEVLLDVRLKPADQRSSSFRPVILRSVAELMAEMLW